MTRFRFVPRATYSQAPHDPLRAALADLRTARPDGRWEIDLANGTITGTVDGRLVAVEHLVAGHALRTETLCWLATVLTRQIEGLGRTAGEAVRAAARRAA